MNERKQPGHITDQEHLGFSSDRGLIGKYLEHQHLAEEFGQRIVIHANRLSEAFHEFSLVNFTEEDLEKKKHPRAKDSKLHGTPRRYTNTYKGTWVSDNGDTRELIFNKTIHGTKIESENIRIINPDSDTEMNFYLNITDVYFELHEDRSFQVLAIVPMADKLEPQVTQNPINRAKKFPDMLDAFKDELALLRSMKKVTSSTAEVTVSEGLQSSGPTL